MEPQVVVGRNIRKHRLEAGLTQEDLADRSGLHQVEVGRAERGVKDIRVSTVARLAKGLEVEALELMRGV